MTATRFYLALVAAFMAVVGVVALFNFVVDPYLLFHGAQEQGSFTTKPAAGEQGWLVKPNLVRTQRPATLVLGASREDVGLDPASAAWPVAARPVFNFGIPGTRVNNHLLIYRYVRAQQMPRHVVVGLDFVNSLELGQAGATTEAVNRRLGFDASGKPVDGTTRQWLYDRLTALASIDALEDSVRTVFDRTGDVSITASGYSPDTSRFARDVASKGSAPAFVATIGLQATPARRRLACCATELTFQHQVAAFAQLLAETRRDGARVLAFVPPSHVYELENFRTLGLWPLFERWKAALTAVVARHNAGVGPRAVLLDFSGYHAVATEAVPPLGDLASTMRYYWEPIHFKRMLGDQIIADLFAPRPTLGIALAPATFCAHLSTTRTQLNEYLARDVATGIDAYALNAELALPAELTQLAPPCGLPAPARTPLR